MKTNCRHRYSKAMNQPYPRLCVDCGEPEPEHIMVPCAFCDGQIDLSFEDTCKKCGKSHFADPVKKYFVKNIVKDGKFELSMCSRVFFLGDRVFHDTDVSNQGFIWTESHSNKMRKDNVYKVIGKVSLEAIWVKDGDMFYEDELFVHGGGFNWSPEYSNYTFKIKGPCGHFH